MRKRKMHRRAQVREHIGMNVKDEEEAGFSGATDWADNWKEGEGYSDIHICKTYDARLLDLVFHMQHRDVPK